MERGNENVLVRVNKCKGLWARGLETVIDRRVEIGGVSRGPTREGLAVVKRS